MTSLSSDEKQFLRENIAAVKNFLKEKKYQAALQSAEELLLAFPDNIDVFHLREKAWQKRRDEKFEIVKKAIKEAEPLWKSHNYEELQKVYDGLNQYFPDSPLIQNKLLKLHDAVQSTEKRERAEYVKKGLSLAKCHEKKGEFREALQVLQDVSEIDPANTSVARAFNRAREKYVDNSLESTVKPLIAHGEYEEALHLATNLLKVMPEYKKLLRMIRHCEGLIIRKRLEEKKSYIEASLTKIRHLFHNRKYEQCLEACRELLSLDPKNFRAKYWTARAIYSDRQTATRDLFDQMTRAWRTMGDAIRTSVGKRGPVEGMKGWRRI